MDPSMFNAVGNDSRLDPNGSCLFAAGSPTDTVGSQNSSNTTSWRLMRRANNNNPASCETGECEVRPATLSTLQSEMDLTSYDVREFTDGCTIQVRFTLQNDVNHL